MKWDHFDVVWLPTLKILFYIGPQWHMPLCNKAALSIYSFLLSPATTCECITPVLLSLQLVSGTVHWCWSRNHLWHTATFSITEETWVGMNRCMLWIVYLLCVSEWHLPGLNLSSVTHISSLLWNGFIFHAGSLNWYKTGLIQTQRMNEFLIVYRRGLGTYDSQAWGREICSVCILM